MLRTREFSLCRLLLPFQSRSYCADRPKLILDSTKLHEELGMEKGSISKSKETKLASYLKGSILIRGPLTVSQFFREALTNEKYGYYTKKENIFGTKGDFITAPEISQMFGELIGIWIRKVFHDQFPSETRPSSFRIIEFGPGKGTLMADMIRTLQSTETDKKRQIAAHFVEASPNLRKFQAKALGCSDDICKMVGDEKTSQEKLEQGFETGHANITAFWHREARHIPGDDPVFVIAQEFLDALPVNVFEYTKQGWRELLVDTDQNPGNHHFRYLLADSPSVASMALDKHPKIALPSTYVPKVGKRVEVSIDRASAAESFAELIKKRKGAGLIIDYGNDFPPSNTLRACRNHQFDDFLCEPGDCDITSDVDFQSLRGVFDKCLDKDEKKAIKTNGPITQGGFLKEMGIQSRVIRLLDAAGDNEEKIKDVIAAYRRLVDAEEMGSTYKVLAFSPVSSPALVGFPPKE